MWGILPGGPLTVLFIVSGFVLFLPAAVRGGASGDDGCSRSAAPRDSCPRTGSASWSRLLLAGSRSGPGLPGIGPIATHVTMLQTPALLFDGPVTSTA